MGKIKNLLGYDTHYRFILAMSWRVGINLY